MLPQLPLQGFGLARPHLCRASWISPSQPQGCGFRFRACQVPVWPQGAWGRLIQLCLRMCCPSCPARALYWLVHPCAVYGTAACQRTDPWVILGVTCSHKCDARALTHTLPPGHTHVVQPAAAADLQPSECAGDSTVWVALNCCAKFRLHAEAHSGCLACNADHCTW